MMLHLQLSPQTQILIAELIVKAAQYSHQLLYFKYGLSRTDLKSLFNEISLNNILTPQSLQNSFNNLTIQDCQQFLQDSYEKTSLSYQEFLKYFNINFQPNQDVLIDIYENFEELVKKNVQFNNSLKFQQCQIYNRWDYSFNSVQNTLSLSYGKGITADKIKNYLSKYKYPASEEEIESFFAIYGNSGYVKEKGLKKLLYGPAIQRNQLPNPLNKTSQISKTTANSPWKNSKKGTVSKEQFDSKKYETNKPQQPSEQFDLNEISESKEYFPIFVVKYSTPSTQTNKYHSKSPSASYKQEEFSFDQEQNKSFLRQNISVNQEDYIFNSNEKQKIKSELYSHLNNQDNDPVQQYMQKINQYLNNQDIHKQKSNGKLDNIIKDIEIKSSAFQSRNSQNSNRLKDSQEKLKNSELNSQHNSQGQIDQYQYNINQTNILKQNIENDVCQVKQIIQTMVNLELELNQIRFNDPFSLEFFQVNKKHKIGFQEFTNYFQEAFGNKCNNSILQSIFNLYDRDMDNSLNEEEWKSLFLNIQNNSSVGEVNLKNAEQTLRKIYENEFKIQEKISNFFKMKTNSIQHVFDHLQQLDELKLSNISHFSHLINKRFNGEEVLSVENMMVALTPKIHSN